MNERERIEYLMECFGLTPSIFADKTGIPRASVSHILSGRNKPSLEVLQKVAASFPNVDIQWLMLGVGVAPTAMVSQSATSDMLRVQPKDGNSLFDEMVQPKQESDIPAVQQLSNTITSREYQNIAQETVRSNRNVASKTVQAERVQRKNVQNRSQQEVVKRIKEIRVFYNDGTYEILYPEK